MEQYQVSFVAAIKRAFSNYCVFTGRASRSEYWWFFLFTSIVGTLLSIPSINSTLAMISAASQHGAPVMPTTSVFSYLSQLWSVAILLPSLGLLFRRLHDTGRSGWNWLWGLLPVIGTIVLLVFLCSPSTPAENKYGPVPNVKM